MNQLKDLKVSIIVPVYNVESFLPKCLECVSDQTYSNLEVILVDDGSKDRSGEICDAYKASHNNTIVIHQRNMGLSGARNSGVREATGDYITFVDSDDIISKRYVEKLVYALQYSKCDLAVGRSLQFWNENSIKERDNEEVIVYKTEEALIQMCNGYLFGVSACCKLYKKEVLLKYPYPLGKLYEDLDTTYKIFGECKSIALYNEYIYFYRQRSNSISHHNKLNESQLYGLIAADNQYNYIRENYPKATVAAQARCILKAFDYIEMISGGSRDEKNSFLMLQQYAVNHSNGILRNKNVNKPNKARLMCIKMGYYPSVIGFRLLELLKKRRAKLNGDKL